MDFCSGDDMNAKMSVQTIRRFGGFWTTFYISRLHVQGTVCNISSGLPQSVATHDMGIVI